MSPVTVSRNDQSIFWITAANLTPVTGSSIGLIFSDPNAPTPVQIPPLDPADAFAIGDAMQKAARRAGYNPTATPPPPA